MVRPAHRRRGAVRPDQHRGQGDRVRREDRPGPDRHRRHGGQVPSDDAAPGDLLQDPGQLPARAAGTRRAGRGDPRVALVSRGDDPPYPPRRVRWRGECIGRAVDSGGTTMTSTPAEYPTSLGTSDADTITLLGQNLAEDLMGKVGFGELTLWMV